MGVTARRLLCCSITQAAQAAQAAQARQARQVVQVARAAQRHPYADRPPLYTSSDAHAACSSVSPLSSTARTWSLLLRLMSVSIRSSPGGPARPPLPPSLHSSHLHSSPLPPPALSLLHSSLLCSPLLSPLPPLPRVTRSPPILAPWLLPYRCVHPAASRLRLPRPGLTGRNGCTLISPSE